MSLTAALARTFVEIIYPLVEKYDGSVISWRRSRMHNATLPDSVSNSLHLIGCAMDVQFDSQDQKNKFAVDARNLGLQVVVKNVTVHVELDQKGIV